MIPSDMHKKKVLNVLLIASSLLGYLEWGTDSHTFLFQAETEVIGKLLTEPLAALHPLTILPMLGQIALLVTLFQKITNRILTWFGLGSIGLLLLIILLSGLLGKHALVALSTAPFFITAMLTIRELQRKDP
jgi:hypothetical protein